jgi:hypothetical protein
MTLAEYARALNDVYLHVRDSAPPAQCVAAEWLADGLARQGVAVPPTTLSIMAARAVAGEDA